MRAGRWRHAIADPAADHAAARDPRPDLGRHLLVYAIVERVHLRTRLHPEQRQQDRARRDPDRTRLRRRLSMGCADGRLAARFTAGRGVLLAVRRLLRLVADRRGEGVAGPGFKIAKTTPCTVRLGPESRWFRPGKKAKRPVV